MWYFSGEKHILWKQLSFVLQREMGKKTWDTHVAYDMGTTQGNVESPGHTKIQSNVGKAGVSTSVFFVFAGTF